MDRFEWVDDWQFYVPVISRQWVDDNKGCVQWCPVYDKKDFHLQQGSIWGLLEQQAKALPAELLGLLKSSWETSLYELEQKQQDTFLFIELIGICISENNL